MKVPLLCAMRADENQVSGSIRATMQTLRSVITRTNTSIQQSFDVATYRQLKAIWTAERVAQLSRFHARRKNKLVLFDETVYAEIRPDRVITQFVTADGMERAVALTRAELFALVLAPTLITQNG